MVPVAETEITCLPLYKKISSTGEIGLIEILPMSCSLIISD